MKLLINTDFTWHFWCNPGDSDQEIQQFQAQVADWCSVADRFGCSYSVDYPEYGVHLVLHQQKCTLDEADMNTLFDGFFTNMFNVGLEYCPLGGEGCDFAMILTCVPKLL
jgi:hypothetical protein|tara:strand:- start:858 stop:1187 length:330 start_codon:yes stop_codon:yes gene_type:complete